VLCRSLSCSTRIGSFDVPDGIPGFSAHELFNGKSCPDKASMATDSTALGGLNAYYRCVSLTASGRDASDLSAGPFPACNSPAADDGRLYRFSDQTFIDAHAAGVPFADLCTKGITPGPHWIINHKLTDNPPGNYGLCVRLSFRYLRLTHSPPQLSAS
jgi:hypothetical protein